MNIQQAVMAFSQSEKIKAGLIWVSQALEMIRGLPDHQRPGGEKVVRAILDMICQEVNLAKNLAGGQVWVDMETHINQAVVMVQSGVGPDAVVLLTKALSQVTNIGQRSMTILQKEGVV